jgi:hypothetical protein
VALLNPSLTPNRNRDESEHYSHSSGDHPERDGRMMEMLSECNCEKDGQHPCQRSK